MNRILSDTIAFGKQYMRTKVGAFFSFIFPILLIVLFGAIFSGAEGGGMSLPVQNMDGGPVSIAFIEMLNETNYFEVSMISPDEDFESYFTDNSLSMALYIPEGFSENVSLGQPVAVLLYGDEAKSTYGIAMGVLGAVVSQFNYNLSGATELVALGKGVPPEMEDYGAYDFFLPGFVGLTVMISAMYFMTSTCAEHRSRGYFKLLATTTLTKSEWLVSKFLFNSAMLILSLLVTFAVAMSVFDLQASLTPLAFVLVIAGAFMFTALGMLFGIVVKDPESGAALSNAVGFPMMFLSGAFWDLSLAPAYLQAISKAMPLTYLNDGLRDTMVYANQSSALSNLAIIVVLGLVFFVLASRLMSWKEK